MNALTHPSISTHMRLNVHWFCGTVHQMWSSLIFHDVFTFLFWTPVSVSFHFFSVNCSLNNVLLISSPRFSEVSLFSVNESVMQNVFKFHVLVPHTFTELIHFINEHINEISFSTIHTHFDSKVTKILFLIKKLYFENSRLTRINACYVRFNFKIPLTMLSTFLVFLYLNLILM